MKKIYWLLGIAILLASCNMKKDDTKDSVIVEEETIVVTEPLDGLYEGKLPAASGEGMDVKITLSGNTYAKSITYIGKSDEPIETSGEFIWDEGDSIITLVGEEAPNKYLAGENTLTHLDVDGNIIAGDLADMYILRKK
ncbi:MAG: copper resistance protein NlpE [Tannerellaceae bacterium]|jgi:uncharacterized lipoprotein NlpE involved in copper resistance|nr:copper resistance protein NlpE [Tannerellaceae bacterium]